ncbi:MAG: Stp1/IreP family PP2C-type Ser/Thr phosphatase [Candidatus Desulforudaceae bacterium]|nr:Stp1/IreP family PP2C-type Ser/Thr phosphatase [Bacillota bacterium]MBU4554659.1 Stp1/IreP family PP2C-type Ser/Thr phosphatase [Bacillota bacterium]MBV1726441.1 Stp1/IreP family PP2C-type Ser/Thr phosphatase [Desulforudis sp.]MBV1735438.1 Stp1/IreP family PP2C-type Ser/Thr phosphatase [Desulforudis sp.]MBV1769919.1 Stp1/IreP family PP2C-type Ser/Thr phosphatase [Desulforudis sp.]
MKWDATSNVGLVRPNNEDAFCVNEQYRLFAVADGMGGHKAGEVASRLALGTLEAEYVRLLQEGESPAGALYRAVIAANNQVFDESRRSESHKGMGTTLTACILQTGKMVFVHVGDSRIYLIRDGNAVRLTEDHSVVQELIKQGKLTDEEAESHPYRNMLSRALGTEGGVQVDVQDYVLNDGDQILLCTDGLTGLVQDEEIAQAVSTAGQPAESVGELLNCALKRGGKDNITLVLVEFEKS